MSSSYAQKKAKTLATRKKTRKRKNQAGMTHEDESGRLAQPPSRRDPRWKKPDVSEIVESVMRAKKKQRMSLLGGEDDEDDDEDDDLPEMVDPIESDDEGEKAAAVAVAEPDKQVENGAAAALDDEEEDEEDDGRPKPIVKLTASFDDCVAAATKAHNAIRRKDTRQKAKVLILVDTPSLFKGLKKSLGIKAEHLRATSKRGVRSSGDKKLEVSYKNIGPLKTPMEKFKESNEDVLKSYKIGKIVTLLAEDMSYYPYSDLSIQHLIFVAKSPQSAINLDRKLLHNVELHTFVVNEKLSAADRSQLADKFVVME